MNDIEPIDRYLLLDRIKEELPQPLSESNQLGGELVFIGGDPGEVVVRMNRTKVTVAIFRVEWEGSHTPVVRPQVLATLSWRRLPAIRMMMTLHDMIAIAKEIRKARYRKCERCGETKPPEWMHNATICQSCAEKHLGVVY